jgi:lysophospholipase L1-like esterase
MNKKNIFLTIILIFALAFSSHALAAPPTDKGGPPGGGDSTTETINYLALGDSIAYGTGATNDYGYVYHYRDFLATNGTEEDLSDDKDVKLTNKSLRGIKTNDLLAQLKLDKKVQRLVKNADYITVSIGGNNLLSCASDNYSYIDDTCAQNGVDNFERDWVQIIAKIRDLNPNATVKSLNLYNPYRDDSTDSSEKALFDQANGYIQKINDEFAFNLNLYTYNIVDVYGAFSGTFDDGSSFKVSTYTHFSEEKRDPHPTDAGHILIAELHQ